jgi:hypothetical protein
MGHILIDGRRTLCSLARMNSTRFALSTLSALTLVGMLAARASADPTPIYGAVVPVYQPAEPSAMQPIGAAMAFASTLGASHIERVAFVPFDGLTCNATNLRSVDIFDVDTNGDVTSPIFSGDTSCMGTGNWTAGKVAVSATLSYDLPAGHTLYASWQPSGTGVALPAGAWRIE